MNSSSKGKFVVKRQGKNNPHTVFNFWVKQHKGWVYMHVSGIILYHVIETQIRFHTQTKPVWGHDDRLCLQEKFTSSRNTNTSRPLISQTDTYMGIFP